MAKLLWGKVYFKETFAGYLKEEPGDRFSFTYDEVYMHSENPPIAYTLPFQESPHLSENALPPFFDNLVAEGWLEQAQSRLLGKRQVNRFELLLAFGFDCAGAVWVVDPEPSALTESMLVAHDPKEQMLLTSRASLSGVQSKLAIVRDEQGRFRPAQLNELSTHIAKFPSPAHPEIIENEYLTTLAFKELLPEDDVVNLQIGEVEGINEPALLIKRFDRVAGQRLHFEEFNQFLGHRSREKYNGAHKDMADFISRAEGCVPSQNYTLYKRILAGILLGNTDMHFKNFAMFHTTQGFRFTPSYDQVAALQYGYKTLALSIAGASNLAVSTLKPANILKLGEEFALSKTAIKMAIDSLAKNQDAAKHVIMSAKWGSPQLKENVIAMMEKRWNGAFALIGNLLSKKQSKDAKNKN